MTARDRIIDALRTANVADTIENGPGIRVGRSVWVEARDRTNGMILLGGLGGFGVGTMWVEDDEFHQSRDYFGYDDAPERTCDDQWKLDYVQRQQS